MLTMSDSADLRPQSLASLQGKNDAESIKKAAKEMEALFAYELIKVMRETTEQAGDGLGNSTYLSMFDMELSKLFAERGLGLGEMIERSLTATAAKARSTSSSSQPQNGAQPEIQSLVPDLPAPRISSEYGMRQDPFSGDWRFHHGVDIAAPEGTEIHAVAPGTVVFSGKQAGYGNVVIIDHGNGYTTKYAHNQQNLVKEGDKIDSGSLIARAGSTGRSTGSHVHFEVLLNGRSVDPNRLSAKG
ncbi:MAG TPA: peptidoglycan DD-metalloendopeptidase family protein [Nitrospirota bacterium]|nr:peptidoglycan DD-metalloendopeptidase family protein [Nitrospirota bacterium]